MRRICWVGLAAARLVPLTAASAGVPEGFTPIFNGKDLTGWHISQVNHHGDSQGWSVEDGVLSATQDRPGNGGILLTDEKYADFEVSLEIKPDWGCDGGLFLRSNEKGELSENRLDERHAENFLDCVRTRKQPNCTVYMGHRSAQASLLATRAYVNGRTVRFDPVKEEVFEG